MKLSKRVKLFVALLATLYSVSLISSTYAKYVSGLDDYTNMSIARWNIVLSGSDNGSHMEGNIIPKFTGNQYIGTDVIAPTANGYFDVAINGLDTDVAFDYTLDVTVPDDSLVTDLVVTKYQIKNGDTWGNEVSFNGDTYVVSNSLMRNSSTIVRFYVTWKDGTSDDYTESMNNSKDTEASLIANEAGSTSKAKLHVSSRFVQKVQNS